MAWFGAVDWPVRRPGGATRRRIALVEFAPAGGLFQFSVQLGEGLARRDHSVCVVTGPGPELESRERGCSVRALLPTWHPAAGAEVAGWRRRARRGFRAGRYCLAWMILLGWLARARPDVVLWSAWRFSIDGWGVRLTRRLLPAATLGIVAHEPRPLVEQPGADGHYKSGPALRRALAGAYRCLNAVFVLGERAKGVLVDSWPVRAPVTVIPHGDEGIFAGTSSVPSTATSGPRALFFGTVTGYKGIEDLLACWPRVREVVADAELLVAGNVGADIDVAGLQRRVAELDGVELRAGYVPVAQVAEVFGGARLVVLPYRRGSQSGVAHLAFTFGRPVVATAVGDIPSVVRDGQTGVLVPTDDHAALSAALMELLTDPARAAMLGSAGKAALAAGATWDVVAVSLEEGLPEPGGTPAEAAKAAR